MLLVKRQSSPNESALNLDLTVPDPARMIDFWLGGNHHFEVDRAMARSIDKLTPLASHWVRLQRQFLRRVVTYLVQELQHTNFLVAGAGLPTCGNVHEVAPECRVIYTDINPVTIAFGRNLLGTNPLVRYVYQDARELHRLAGDEVTGLFGADRRMVVIYVGFSYFFRDHELRETLEALYHWVGPGSHLALTSIGEDAGRYANSSVDAYSRMGYPLYLRSCDQTREAIRPWQVTTQGIRAASHWGLEESLDPAPPVFIHGCLATRSV